MTKRNKIISFIEIVLGIVLLTREIYQMTFLPSIHDDNSYGGLIDFAKYKENTYSLIFLWLLLLLTGITGLISSKLNWIFTQSLLITIFGILSLTAVFLGKNEPLFIGAFILISIGFFILEKQQYRADLLEKLEITNRTKIISILSGLLCSLIYWIIEI
jgi:hypothetical protein